MNATQYGLLRHNYPELKLPSWNSLGTMERNSVEGLDSDTPVSIRAAKILAASYVSPNGFLVTVNERGEHAIDFTPFFQPLK
jgi:hypothetical protein